MTTTAVTPGTTPDTSAAGPVGTGPITTDRIRAVLPHRHPMLLVDRVLHLEPGVGLRAIKAVTASEPWYAGLDQDPARPVTGPDYAYPHALLVESWCQAAGVLATWTRPNPDVRTGRVMLFGAISEITFGAPVLPGDVLEHRVVLDREVGDTVIFSGAALVDGTPVLSVGRVVVAFRPAGSLQADAPAGAPQPPTDTERGRTHE